MSTTPSTIEASIAFDYQGERYAITTLIDLDRLMAGHQTLPSLHPLLAKEMGIDPYSYQYEMLLAEPIHFTRGQGLACKFLQNGRFDKTGFETAWREQNTLSQLQEIARRQLGVDDLSQQPALREALREAFEAGRKRGDKR
ncbi:MAG TPA: hypothetical protein ENI97_16190 [Gammaproteobacteria bacterium]|nr:hypothetical protein [Gammaproteobacteria bacterium]